ncbi:MAG: glycosyltransferase [Gammaproteobacteria bacterium]
MAAAPPYFSVVICNFNYGRFLGAAIDSALAQHYPAGRMEIIVVDDGSTDESRAVLADRARGGCVEAVLQDNAGQAAAFVAGIARARGQYVCLLDSDDWYLPHKLTRVQARIERLGSPPDLLLLHDYEIHDDARGVRIAPSWFASRGLPAIEGASIADPSTPVAITIPCAQIYARALLQRLCESLPTADFRGGTDVVLGHAAFVAARRLHYLHEPLAAYRVHGSNEMGAIDSGRLVPKRPVIREWPRRLWYLEKLVDSLDDGADARRERLGYLRRMERDLRTTSAARGLREPVLDFVILGGGNPEAIARTQESIDAQTHAKHAQFIVGAAGDRALAGEPHGATAIACTAEAACLARMAAGYRAGTGAFVCFVEAGDTFDPTFAERHLHALQYGPPSMLSASDVRLIDEAGVLLQSMPLHAGGAWRAPAQFVAPLSAYLHELRWPPIGASVLRRSALLERLFDVADTEYARAADPVAPWVLQQWAHAMGGGQRLAECLFGHRIADAAQAGAWFAASLPPAPMRDAAAALLLESHCTARAALGARFDDEWHARFVAWTVHGRDPQAVDALRAIARAHADDDTLDLIDAVVALQE